MSKFTWSTNKVNTFIDLFHQNECLWNNTSDDYKNTNLKKTTFNKIVEEMNCPELTVVIVKEKIKSIRTIYRRELNKVLKSLKSGSGSNDIYEPKLFWFTRVDAFLRPVPVLRNSSSNLENPENDITELDIDDESSQALDSAQNISEQLLLKLPQPEADETLNMSTSKQTKKSALAFQPEVGEHHTPKMKRNIKPPLTLSLQPPRKKQKNSEMSDIHKSVERLENIMSYKEPEENEFDIFGRSVAAQLKQYPLLNALQCQKEIQDLLSVQRIQLLKHQQSYPITTPNTDSDFSRPSTSTSNYSNILEMSSPQYSYNPDDHTQNGNGLSGDIVREAVATLSDYGF